MASNTGSSGGSSLSPTDPDLLNFFRLCRIVLEDIPGVLRTVFRDEIFNKYGKEWIDGKQCGQWFLQQERFHTRLNNTQKDLLKSGNVDDWDVTLLVHALLYSSQLLLASSFHNNQTNLKQNDPYVLVSVSQKVDFTRHLRRQDVILCDVGQELVRNEVKSVRPTEIVLKYPVKQNPVQVGVHLCRKDWFTVQELSALRNSQFAHCKNARIAYSPLKNVVQKVKRHYFDLRIKQHRITSMEKILTETYRDESLFKRLEDYCDSWHKEITTYVALKEGIEFLKSDLEDLKLTLQDMEKDSEAQKVDMKKQHDDILELQSELTQTKENVSEVKTHQHMLDTKTKDAASHLLSLESKQLSMEEKHSFEIEVVKQQQVAIDHQVGHAVELVKQVSDDQKSQEKIISSLQETKKQLSEEVEKTGEFIHQLSVKDEELQGQIGDLKSDITDIQQDIVKVKSEIEDIQQKGSSKLNVSHFESDVRYYSEKYHAGTRQWLFDDIAAWKEKMKSNRNQPNMCLVSANPGMGKSVLAAKLCTTYKEKGVLAGCFFFQHHLGRRSNPIMLVQSLCHQFQSAIPGYSKLIEDEIVTVDPESLTVFELFSYLIKEPLSRLSCIPETMMIVIDALDECDYESRSDLLKLLIRDFIKLPRWIQIILTTRPDKKILHSLKRIKSVIDIIPDDSRNLEDIRLFLRDFLMSKMPADEIYSGVKLLVEKSEGMFLYFHYTIDMLEDQEKVSLEELRSLLPDGIDDYYEQNFSRLYETIGQSKYQVFLQGILMARSDFPQNLMEPLLEIGSEEAKKIMAMVSALFPIHSGSICIFHKSLKDWLQDKELAGKYAVEPLAGHRHLAILCQDQLKKLIAKFSSLPFHDFVNNSSYQFVVENAVYHTCHGGTPSQSLNIIEDLQFMYFRLLFSQGAASSLLDDINEALLSEFEDSKKALLDCCDFVKRHSHDLAGHPSLIFQCALNEPRAFSERLGISKFFADPLRAFPGLKVLLQVENKFESFISPTITFSSDDDITSCTLSPSSEFVVLSDSRGFVYFWDIAIGEVINKIDLSEEFKFPYHINVCSVSPDKNVIVYGNPKKALNFTGEKVPLLETDIKQEINSCIFSPDGKKLFSFAFYQDGLFRFFEELQVPFKIDFYVQLWDVSSSMSQTLQVIKRKENRIVCACFSSDGKKIYSGYRNGVIVQWDSETCLASAYILSPEVVIREDFDSASFGGNDNIIFAVSVSPNNHFLAASTKQGLQIWDAAALDFLALFTPNNPAGKYTNCSFSPDSRHLAVGTSHGYLEVIGIEDFTFNRIVSVQPDGSSKPLKECLFVSPSSILCAVGNTGRIYELDALIQNSSSYKNAVHPGIANQSVILPEKALAITLGSKSVCLWDIQSCTLITTGKGSVGGYLLRLSADGKTMLTYGDRCYIEVWDVESLTKTNDLVHMKQRNLPIGRDDPDESSPTDICHCAVSVDGIVVGGTGNGDLFVWYGDKLESIKELEAHECLVTFIEFSPDGVCFVSADMDGIVFLWQLPNKREEKFNVNMIPLTCHSDSVEQISYSSHGRRLATCSMDKTIHLYSGASGDLIAKLSNHIAGVMKIAFSSNGGLIVSGDEKGEIIIWDAVTGRLLQHIKPNITRIIADLHFVGQDMFVSSRDHSAGYVVVHEVCSGNEVSRLSFDTEIFSMSASTIWKENSYLVCCLKDSSVKFVKLLDSDSMHVVG